MTIYTLTTQELQNAHIRDNVRTGVATFTTGGGASLTVSVVFGTPFSRAPAIVATPSTNVKVNLVSITASGFTIVSSVLFDGSVYWKATLI